MEMTYEALLKIQHSILRESEKSEAFAYLNKERIKSFFAKNKMRLDLANKKLADLFEAHVKKDEKGIYVSVQKDELTRDWEFNSPEDEADYKEAYTAFMSRTIEVH